MAGMLEREEWKAFSDAIALVAAGVLSLVGLVLAVAGKDPVMAFHGCPCWAPPVSPFSISSRK